MHLAAYFVHVNPKKAPEDDRGMAIMSMLKMDTGVFQTKPRATYFLYDKACAGYRPRHMQPCTLHARFLYFHILIYETY
jgi:hypothetical protein